MTTTHEHPADAVISRWSPWPELSGWNARLAQLLEPVWHHGYLPSDHVAETDEGFTVELDLPGVSKDEITIDVTGRRLSIHGERAETEQTGTLRHSSRVTGAFSYELTLPAPVDEAKTAAQLTGGVLTVRLPKAQGAATTRIAIN